MNPLNEIESTVLSKVKGRPVEAGSHHVDFFVHVVADITKGEDYPRASTTSIPIKKALALFIQYSGITREAAINTLVKAMKDAVDSNIALDVVESAEQRVNELIGELPPTTCSGPTKVKNLLLERVDL